MRAGEAKRAQLVATQKDFVAELAAKDREYAEQIAIFRGAVSDIASTPEGLAALARYNAGDQVGALAILDKLQAADEAARQRATDVRRQSESATSPLLHWTPAARGKSRPPPSSPATRRW